MSVGAPSKVEQIWAKFSAKAYREAFVRSHVISNIAAQLFTLREREKKTQKQLADECGMAQTRISVIENGASDNLTLNTLTRIAAAFDVALIVRFVAFSEVAQWVANVTEDKLAPPEFGNDKLSFETLSGDAISFKENLRELLQNVPVDDLFKRPISQKNIPLQASQFPKLSLSQGAPFG